MFFSLSLSLSLSLFLLSPQKTSGRPGATAPGEAGGQGAERGGSSGGVGRARGGALPTLFGAGPAVDRADGAGWRASVLRLRGLPQALW